MYGHGDGASNEGGSDASNYGPALSALVDRFPEPAWDEETARKTFDKLVRRIDRRAAFQRALKGFMVAVGMAVAASAGALLMRH